MINRKRKAIAPRCGKSFSVVEEEENLPPHLVLLARQREGQVTAQINRSECVPSLKQTQQHEADADPALKDCLGELGLRALPVGRLLYHIFQLDLS